MDFQQRDDKIKNRCAYDRWRGSLDVSKRKRKHI